MARIEGTEPDPSVRTFEVIASRYEREVMPTKAARTQRDNLIELDKLRAVFGRMLIEAIKPHHLRGYPDKRGQTAKARANREWVATMIANGATPTRRTSARA